MPTGTVGLTFNYEGGSEALIFKLDASKRGGVQITFEGFDAEDATFQYIPQGGTTPITVTGSTGPAPVLIGEGFSLSQISISGLAAGEYPITCIQ